ncbi:hypothetical protein HPB48_010700 [Haemaphysalis longicornis]|uniref:Uncharacterized protein n=1 Tax=Haemaphysalis longicornis TaxID=44386 RepID=A0A9J6GAU2_HAELO|nr:hypothetical protein HPB48_010700 [Haemaphysalis longicornis]
MRSAFSEFVECKSFHVERECGDRASAFFARHMQRISGPLMEDHCGHYAHEGGCDHFASSGAARWATTPPTYHHHWPLLLTTLLVATGGALIAASGKAVKHVVRTRDDVEDNTACFITFAVALSCLSRTEHILLGLNTYA